MDRTTFTENDYLKAEIINLRKKLDKEKKKSQPKCKFCGDTLQKSTSTGALFCMECHDM